MTDWPVKTLGDVCEVIAGQSPEGKFYNQDGKGTPFYQGKKDFTERFLGSPTTWTTEVTKLARPGDILMSVRAPVGPVNLCPIEACIGRGLAAIRPSSKTDTDFIYYYLESIQSEIAGTEGAVFASINKAQIAELNCPVPPLEEQKRIVALLDAATERVTELTACYEQARTHANNLFESLYDDCFEQQLADTPLGDIADLNGGYAFKSSDYTESGVFVLRTLNIDSKGDVTRRKEAFVSKARMEEFDRFKLFSGDILFVMVGATLGKTGVVKEADLPALLNQNMWVIRAKKDLIDPRYLYFVFMKYSKTLLSGAAGTARAFVKRDDFRNLFVPVPTLDEQKRIVVRLDSMKSKTTEMVAAYDAKLAAAKNLRQSILEAAFAGDL